MYSNFHAHTKYCDGSCTVEEMVRGAIDMGLDAFGLSGHAHTPGGWGEMTVETTAQYVADIRAAQEKYAGWIELFCGIEQDFLSDLPTDGYDYVIGAVHTITLPTGEEHNVDYIASESGRIVKEYFNGDFYSYIEEYYRLKARVALQTKCDIVAHLDLVTKYNEGSRFFDEAHPRYRAAAIAAMEEILKTCNLFEVNTGAMFRVGNTNPYPAPWLLRELLARGGEVILSSDAHATKDGWIGYRFPEMEELLRAIGFKYRKTLTRSGFVDIKL